MRRVSITNSGARTREIEVTSYAEVVLAPAAADDAHPAFSNLFVQTERVAERDTLLATRRRRSPSDADLARARDRRGRRDGRRSAVGDGPRAVPRPRARRAPPRSPMTRGIAVRTRAGSVLDPIVSLRRRVRIRPGRTVHVAFSTLVAPHARRGARSRRQVPRRHDVRARRHARVDAGAGAAASPRHRRRRKRICSRRSPDPSSMPTARCARRPTSLRATGWRRRRCGRTAFPATCRSCWCKIDDADDVGIVRQLLQGARILAHEAAGGGPRHPQRPRAVVSPGPADAARHAGAHEPVHDRARRERAAGRIFTLRAEQMTAAQQDVLERARASSSRAGAGRSPNRSRAPTAASPRR